MPDGDLGTGLLDTLNNGLKQIIEQLTAIQNALEGISNRIDLVNEAASTIIDILTTQETDRTATQAVPPFEFKKLETKKPTFGKK
jgi:hypothetical protein